ncbi:DUF2569 domain-containing protein [Paenibacillus sp. 1011MAR3C5]|uniref:DUF2569 domain-containing protein n=1 Tax=Paenibacillus sp. 1011MAR3C5 TaxID=1675787 RepID=UPI000E6CBEDC|nr:DUF2569 domain-containing protein [Paenibacillus sp. 1011MAR3C5]RJE90260.1 DUF2569 domain-containing protein [Paenibacillus sp. 1011MAR3C5]
MEAKTQATQDNQPYPQLISGLGGWLVLIQIGLYVTMLMLIFQLMSTVNIFGDGTWELFTDKSSMIYHSMWKPLILFEIIYNVLFFAFCIFILVCFYSKKAILPRLMIIYFGLSLLVGIVDYILLMQIPFARELEDGGSIRDMIRAAVTFLIWIPYFIRSVRVKHTFIH